MSFVRLLMAPLLVMERDPIEASKLIKQLMSRRVRVRREAIEELAPHVQATGDRYLPELLQALADRDGDVRACAAHLLGGMGPAGAMASTALARALSDSEEDVRIAAAYALGHIGAADDSLVPVLLRQMLDRDDGVRVAVIQALGALGTYGKGAVTAILEALQRPQWEERWAAAIALGNLGEARALPFLHQRFHREPDELVRARLLGAIAALGNKAPAWVAVFLDGLEDPTWEVRQQAALALAQWGPAANVAVEPLCERIGIEDDLEARAAMLHAMGKIGDADALPTLLEELESLEVDFTFAIEALIALGRIGGPEVVPVLLESLEDPEPSLRGRAALALGHAGEDSAEIIEILHKLCDDPEAGVQLQATQALARLGVSPEALEATMGHALAFWAARHITTATGMLPLPQDRLDDAILMLPGPEECDVALGELTFATHWLDERIASIWRRQREGSATEGALIEELKAQVTTALAYLQHQPLAPPGAPSGRQIEAIRQDLRTLQQRLHDDPVPGWQASLEEALFE